MKPAFLNKKLFLFVLLSLLFPFLSGTEKLNAQGRTWRMKNKAEYLLNQGRVFEALPLLERYCIRKPEDFATAYFLAEQYRETRDYHKAADWYQMVYSGDSLNYPESLFYYAQMLKMTGASESALNAFLHFQSIYRGRNTNKELRWLLEQEIQGVKMIDSLNRNPRDVIILLLDSTINKIDSEFSPLMLDDSTLIYAGMRNENPVYYNQKLPPKAFHLARKIDYQWVYHGPWDQSFNDMDGIVGNGAFSPDRQRFYFTRCIQGIKRDIKCQIYVTNLKDNKWSDPERLPKMINDPNFTTTHPAVGKDPSAAYREILYFISDRPEGQGGLDVWYSQYNLKTGEFSEPRNAGKSINTPANEFSLFYDLGASRLYFSSNGWAGMGGYDIFRSTGNKRSWTKPENLGKPFNSYSDDLYYSPGLNRQEGFFVSNRTGGINYQDYSCCDDIYNFRWKKFINIIFRGTVAQRMLEARKGLLPDLEEPRVLLYIYDKFSNERILLAVDSLNSPDFQLNLEPEELYDIVVESDNYESKIFSLSTKDYVLSDTLNISFDMELKPEKPIVLNHINFEHDRFELLPQVKTVLDTSLIPFLKNKATLRIEISAHTDNTGTPSYNRELSLKRAQAVRSYLIEMGISSARLLAKGYGELRPLAPNQHPNGSDNPEGRAINRRVEFVILED